MPNPARSMALCCLTALAALLVVGMVSHGVLRHVAQTLPLWGPVLLGLRKSELAKWAALPCLIFWLGIMALIWLYLAGLLRVITGSFSPVEIAMTVVVGAASLCGLVVGFRWRTAVRPWPAAAAVSVFALLQVLALRLSLLPSIAHR